MAGKEWLRYIPHNIIITNNELCSVAFKLFGITFSCIIVFNRMTQLDGSHKREKGVGWVPPLSPPTGKRSLPTRGGGMVVGRASLSSKRSLPTRGWLVVGGLGGRYRYCQKFVPTKRHIALFRLKQLTEKSSLHGTPSSKPVPLHASQMDVIHCQLCR